MALPPRDLTPELRGAAERMDALDGIRQAWTALPPDIKSALFAQGRALWELRRAYLVRFMRALSIAFGRSSPELRAAVARGHADAVRGLAEQAGRLANLPPRQPRLLHHPPGMSAVQVRQYGRRRRARGYVPGQRRGGPSREFELQLDQAAAELDRPESFFTKVTPIPGIGNKEGHEVLTRLAMRGLPLSAADRDAVELGVIRPDRGGRSYWNFPRAALDSLKAAAQPSHALRATPSASVAAALRLIRARFVGLYRRAVRAPTRRQALEWAGEALHLLQDSFSSAHVARAGGTGPIRHIRAFFIRLGWPPLSRAPAEHNAPSDPRDDVFVGGTLRPEAREAARASREFLRLLLRHLGAPRRPGNAAELAMFMRRRLST